jgi:hypothetical protein
MKSKVVICLLGAVAGFVLGIVTTTVVLGRYEYGRYMGMIMQRVDKWTGEETRYPEEKPAQKKSRWARE